MRSWRHAGEHGAVVIYPYRSRNTLTWFLVWTILLVALQNSIFWVAFVAVTATSILAQRRRALILTSNEVIHRPAVAQPTRVALGEITTIRAAHMGGPDLLGPRVVPCVVLQLSNGETCIFPLEAQHPKEALAALSEAAGKEVIKLPPMGKWRRWAIGSIWDG